MSVREIVILNDFFLVDAPHDELLRDYVSHIPICTKYLVELLKLYGLAHPLTISVLQRVGASFHTPYMRILSILQYPDHINITDLRNHLRNTQRAISFSKRKEQHTICCVCRQPVRYYRMLPHSVRQAALTTYCGSILHEACVPVLRNYLFECPICRTKLWQSSPDTMIECRVTTALRRFQRQQNGIPERFPYQIYKTRVLSYKQTRNVLCCMMYIVRVLQLDVVSVIVQC